MTARICICDDDPVVGTLLVNHLEAAGFEVQEPLSSVEQAMGWLAVDAPDVLLLDLNMPAGGGLDLLSWLRSQPALERTQVLMLTGEADPYYIERARRLGARGYLTKPIDVTGLVAKLRRLLDDRQVSWMDDYTIVTSPQTTETAETAQRTRILSVEDVACNQQLVRLFLADGGRTIDQAAGAGEALAALAARPYDLVLMDLRLPDMDGLEVIRHIRSGERAGKRIPILAISADAMPGHVAEALRAGADGHLAKPFTSKALRAAVEARLSPPAGALERLNPVVAELVRTYGETAVEPLLHALLEQLQRLDATAATGGELEHVAHAIKGAAASLGFSIISDACTELETACRCGQTVDTPLRRAEQACARVRSDIASCLKLAA